MTAPLSRLLVAALLPLAAACHDLSRQRPDLTAGDTAWPGQESTAVDLRTGDQRGETDLHGSPDLHLNPDQAPAMDASLPPCVASTDSDTLALYTFDKGSGTTMIDAAGKHHGSIKGSGVQRQPGKKGCGSALHFSGVVTPYDNYALIPDSKDWLFTKGSLDFWIHIPKLTTKRSMGIISRDAIGSSTGHLTVMRSCAGRFVVRLQLKSENRVACSGILPGDAWYHVGINLGAPGVKLYVDGKKGTAKDKDSYGPTCQWTVQCGTPGVGNISGPAEPWVVGAASYHSAAGKPEPVSDPLQGSIDSLRISSARRPFGPP